MKKEIKEGVNRKRNAGNTFVATQISISVISPSYIANNFHFLFISQCLLCHQRYITKLFYSQFTFQKKGVKIIAIGVGNYDEFEGQLEEIAGEDVYTVNSFKQLSDLFAGILEATCSKLYGSYM